MSLKDPSLKMSKSHKDTDSMILLNDSSSSIQNKFRGALTDSETGGIAYDPVNRPGVSNLLSIMASMSDNNNNNNNRGRSIEEIAHHYRDMKILDLKREVAATVDSGLQEIRSRFERLLQPEQGKYLDRVAMEGKEKASRLADESIKNVHRTLGLG